MGFFDGWRKDGGPTLYGPLKTAVTADVLEAGLIYCTVIVAFSLFIVLPGFKGKQILFAFIRMFIGVFVLSSIMLCNYGQEWEVAGIESKTQYRAGLRQDIKAHIGVKIGLRSVNITLKGEPEVQSFMNGLVNETINYNERFGWDNEGWVQGRNGFGPLAGLLNQEYREAQHRGLPYPILWVAEYFTIDGEGIRWGRNYRQAGFFTHALIWYVLQIIVFSRTAFCCWVLALLLFRLMRRYGGYFSLLTGGLQLLAVIIYASIRNPTPLAIPFEDGTLTFHWGWCFVLCGINGLLCVVIGAAIVALDIFASPMLATFFDADAAQELEEVYTNQDELSHEQSIYHSESTKDRIAVAFTQEQASDEEYQNTMSRKPVIVRTFRKRGTTLKRPTIPMLIRKSLGRLSGKPNVAERSKAKPLPKPRFQAANNNGTTNVAFEEEESAQL